MSTATPWDPLTGHYAGCHACGEGGLGLRLWMDDLTVRGEITLDERHAGSPYHAHGGIIATLIDDVLGSVSMAHGIPSVTGTLEIRYRSPAYLGHTYQLSAHLVSVQGRRLIVEGDMTGPRGLVAEATGTWIKVAPEHFLPGG